MTSQEALAAALRSALPRAINFRFVPPRTVADPIWGQVADDLTSVALAALTAAGMSIVPIAVMRTARMVADIHADSIAIEHGSALWEDLQALRTALAEAP